MFVQKSFFRLLVIPLFFVAACRSPLEENHLPENVGLVQTKDVLVSGCVVCHGVQEAQRGPILNGMDNWYLHSQINKFRSGIRGKNPKNKSESLMGVGIRPIQNEVEVAYLAHWFSTQSPQPAIRTVHGNFEMGKDLYVRRCSSCHGESGEGNQTLLSPSLTRLEGWYFYQQMRKFREGSRGYDPRDEGGRVMAAASKNLSDYDIRNLVVYCVESFGLEEAKPGGEHPSSPNSNKPF